jgi:hypothetical protein
MDERNIRLAKNVVEESTEMFALGLFFAGTMEWVLWVDRVDDH